MQSTPYLHLANTPLLIGQAVNADKIDNQNSGSFTRLGAIFMAPKAGTLSAVLIDVAAVAGTVPTYTVDAESVAVGANTPSGTAIGAAGTFVPAAGHAWVNLGANNTVTAGQLFALTLLAAGATAANYATFNWSSQGGSSGYTSELPFALTYTTAWSAVQGNPILAYRYSDGTIFGGYAGTMGNNAYSAISTFNEFASTFVAPSDCTLSEVWIGGTMVDTSASAAVNLYAGTSTTPLASTTIPANCLSALNANRTIRLPLPFTLYGGLTYRIGLQAKVSSHNVSLVTYAYPDAATRAAIAGAIWLDKRGAGGAWGVNVDQTTAPSLIPVLSGISGTAVLLASGVNSHGDGIQLSQGTFAA